MSAYDARGAENFLGLIAMIPSLPIASQMSVVVNNRVLRTFYSKDAAASRISAQIARVLSLPAPNESGILSVPATVAAVASPQLCCCSVQCVEDDLLVDADLVLGADWLAQTSSVLAGLTVAFDNGPVSFSRHIKKRTHAGVMITERPVYPPRRLPTY
jgi:hypothetical protein